jgi:ankyrin repeat protein
MLEVLKILIAFGADPNTKDSNNWAPIHLMARQSDKIDKGTLLEWILS